MVSSREYHERGEDVIVCGVTSNLVDAAYSVLVEPKDVEAGRLLAPSRVKVGRLATLHRTLVRKRVARLKGPVFEQVLKELHNLFPARARPLRVPRSSTG